MITASCLEEFLVFLALFFTEVPYTDLGNKHMLEPWILRALGEQICEKEVERKQGGGCLFLIKRPCPPFLSSDPSRRVFSILHNVHNNRINVLKPNKLGAEFWHGGSDRNRVSCF